MIVLTRAQGPRFSRLAALMGIIGWHRFMEGMISTEIASIQAGYYDIQGGRYSPTAWCKHLVAKLLEITHGQHSCTWHSLLLGFSYTTKRKIQTLIEDQIEVGGEGLADEDKWMLEINLEDLETTSGETQAYWLLAISAARNTWTLRATNHSVAAPAIAQPTTVNTH